ncbi:hypothetical protein SERLA73DRAFT_112603 [Serpula lacrymans var. lacrymans S7.3]|uniref:U3 small nucleolar ribonucleoprotein protein MPP10 n=1 Tax=Serpula lacrymans var. lacrymans (strain S7.3) TaxID=936435 RepID=F8Q6V0_SERL3|nr:hypothetical protein SERLA73DRAFT_112603 [Serpula lacrymans var. lacrymans S7.3]
MAEVAKLELPSELQKLSSFTETSPECIATGNAALQAAALQATKFIFDLALQTERHSHPHIATLLSSLSPAEAPQTRSQTRANGKRKRSLSPIEQPQKAIIIEDTPIPSLFVEDMNEDQVWEQLDLRAKRVCKTLEDALEGAGEELDNELTEENAVDEDSAIFGEELAAFERGEYDEESSDDEEDEDEVEEEDEEFVSEEEIGELRDSSSEEPPFSSTSNTRKQRTPKGKQKTGLNSELDDGFFDLAAFNAETEEAEARSASRGRLDADDDEESEDEDMALDFFEPVQDVENFDEEDLGNGDSEPFYRDFFDAPSRAAAPKRREPVPPKSTSKVRFHEEVRIKNIKAQGKGLPVSTMYEEGDDDDEEDMEVNYDTTDVNSGSILDDIDDEDESEDEADEDETSEAGDDRETIERLKDDLFAEDEEPETDLSAHQKRMTALQAQIRELESENVAEKNWYLKGEASSKGRPQDSLLQEDLEFERVMKAAPIITEELTRGLEDRIKARILEAQFDDVVRVVPAGDKPFLPSRYFELQDTKSTQSLAQIYEDEYTATQSGGVAGEDRDGKLKSEHQEIEKLWENICSKLDALCNAHYVPKQPKATISTVTNVSATSLESALPTSKSASTMLAPEEIYTPSASETRARSELTPSEKQALRNKERKARKRSRDALDKNVDKYAKMKNKQSVKKQKDDALKSIVKNGKGVTVVGKQKKTLVGKKWK